MSSSPRTIGNLCLDGFEEIAARIFRKYNSQGLTVMVIVDDVGRTFTSLRNTRVADPPANHFIGTYDPTTQPETLENDLLDRLREINGLRP